MGILDEAIKEHLELKRQHGADQSELKKLEDEAFGAAERLGSEGSSSDSAAEAPTEFMAQPDPGEAEEPAGEASESDAEATEPEAEANASPVEEAPSRGRTEIADLQEPPVESVEGAEQADSAPEHAEEPSAAEHEAVTEPPPEEAAMPEVTAPAAEAQPEPAAGPSTEERHAISEHPTEMYDVEAELGDAEPADAEPEVHALSEEDEEFWDEKRLSDELDQALEAPVELGEPRIEAAPKAEPEPAEPETRAEPEPAEEEERPSEPEAKDHDVLDETPDFLEESPADEQLWFEQKPPKDFDFDD
jgi:hypothetical protein